MADTITYEDVPQASREAVHKARDAAQALEIARVQQVESIGDIVQERFEHVLSKGTEQERAIILARVPYICQDIKMTKAELEEIRKLLAELNKKMDKAKEDLDIKDEKNQTKYVTKDQFGPVQKVVYGGIGLILTAVVGALLALVLIQH